MPDRLIRDNIFSRVNHHEQNLSYEIIYRDEITRNTVVFAKFANLSHWFAYDRILFKTIKTVVQYITSWSPHSDVLQIKNLETYLSMEMIFAVCLPI